MRRRLREEVEAQQSKLSKPHPRDSKEVKELILGSLPKFVYYSNYGNLDSEIYLPHVIQNLQRENLGQKELAKAWTLKVLFEFVDLEPEEILALGKDAHAYGQQPTEEQVEQVAEKKKERSILLQSASTRLTEKALQGSVWVDLVSGDARHAAVRADFGHRGAVAGGGGGASAGGG